MRTIINKVIKTVNESTWFSKFKGLSKKIIEMARGLSSKIDEAVEQLTKESDKMIEQVEIAACFVAGTKVLTEDGYKPIESIKIYMLYN